MAENIVARILEDARREARERVKTAEAQAAEILEKARREDARLRAEREEERIRAARENEERIRALSAAENRFARLRVRSELADAAFRRSAERLADLPAEEAESFWGGLLARWGEDGEEVILSGRERTLDEDFVRRTAERCGKNFTLSAVKGAFLGGMVLRGPWCDKNLTAEMLVREFREREEAKVLHLLFGENS